jgi:copper homeostasis protein CutC
LGGITPFLGTRFEIKAAAFLPVVVLVRLRLAGFAYSAADRRVMRQDVDLALQREAKGGAPALARI